MTVVRRIPMTPLVTLLLAGFAGCILPPRKGASAKPTSTPVTPEGAATWMAETEAELLKAWIAAQRASWVKSTFITGDTEKMEADANEAVMALTAQKVAESRAYDKVPLSPELKRKFMLLRLSSSLPAKLAILFHQAWCRVHMPMCLCRSIFLHRYYSTVAKSLNTVLCVS